MRTLVLIICSAGVLAAQETAPVSTESVRDAQLRQLELQRTMLLAMADSMPENLYRDKVTPVQRDFAQQIHHAASAAVFICVRFVGAERPSLPDTAVALNSREGLRGYINATYDFTTQVLQQQHRVDRRPAGGQLPQARHGPAGVRVLLGFRTVTGEVDGRPSHGPPVRRPAPSPPCGV
jgi:hypothetical protein